MKIQGTDKSDALLPKAATLAAARFILDVRGLPLEELTVEMDGKTYTAVRRQGESKIWVKMPKCKEICSKIVKYGDFLDAKITECLVENLLVRFLKCSDLRMLSEDVMRGLLYREVIGACDIAAGYEAKGSHLEIKLISNTKKTTCQRLCAALAIASSLDVREMGETVKITCQGKTGYFALMGNGSVDFSTEDNSINFIEE